MMSDIKQEEGTVSDTKNERDQQQQIEELNLFSTSKPKHALDGAAKVSCL